MRKLNKTTTLAGGVNKRGKLMAVGVLLLLALFFIGFFWYGLWTFLRTYTIRTPIIIQSPLVKKNIRPTPHQPRSKRVKTSRGIVPKVEASEREIESWPKYLSEQGIKNRKWVLEYLKNEYSGNNLIAMDNLFKAESAYDPTVINYAGAGGLCQSLPYTKMGCPLEQTEEAMTCQVNWCTQYSVSRYGSPLKAWNFWLAEVPIDGVSFGHWF